MKNNNWINTNAKKKGEHKAARKRELLERKRGRLERIAKLKTMIGGNLKIGNMMDVEFPEGGGFKIVPIHQVKSIKHE